MNGGDETLANEAGDVMWVMEFNEQDNPNYNYRQRNSTKYSFGIEYLYKSVKNGTNTSTNNYPAKYEYKTQTVTPNSDCKTPEITPNSNECE